MCYHHTLLLAGIYYACICARGACVLFALLQMSGRITQQAHDDFDCNNTRTKWNLYLCVHARVCVCAMFIFRAVLDKSTQNMTTGRLKSPVTNIENCNLLAKFKRRLYFCIEVHSGLFFAYKNNYTNNIFSIMFSITALWICFIEKNMHTNVFK